MSDQSHSCDPKRIARQRNLFLCFGALAISLAVGFGYSMASIKYQETFATIADTTAKERASLHNRYMRQLGKKDKEIAALIRICPVGVMKREP